MARSADVVVVGAGAIGTSIAYHLTRRGVRPLLVDRGPVAGGSTGRSAGGVRHQFSSETNVRLSLLSIAAFERFDDEVGGSADFRQYGYLILATSSDEAASFRAQAAMQRSLGVPVEVLEPGETKALVPQIEVGDVIVATWCPTDGYADPYGVAQGYASAARQNGAVVLEGVEVTGVRVAGGRVAGVETADGPVDAPVVVDAAGPWAAQIGAMAGLVLPIAPYRRQAYVTRPFDGLPQRLPMVIDFRTHFYFRREGPGILFGMTDLAEPPGFSTHVDWAFLEKVVAHALHRVPVLAEAQVMKGWAGLYDTTPDANPILGPAGEPDGFFVAAGFSGHGFMHSPAVGVLLAEWIVDGQPTSVDVSPLRLERFADGRPRAEAAVI